MTDIPVWVKFHTNGVLIAQTYAFEEEDCVQGKEWVFSNVELSSIVVSGCDLKIMGDVAVNENEVEVWAFKKSTIDWNTGGPITKKMVITYFEDCDVNIPDKFVDELHKTKSKIRNDFRKQDNVV